MKPTVIIVSSSYGADYIQKIGGQYHIVPVVKNAGADGIEIRRELFSTQELTQLPALAKQISEHQLSCFYSVPEHLFIEEGKLNPDLQHYLAEAKQLQAKLIKFSLGYFNSAINLGEMSQYLTDILTEANIQLVVENDQTECGIISPFEAFFQQATVQNIPIKMTFDTGNWLCLDIDPIEAANRLHQYVAYIHVKAAEQTNKGKINALPPEKDDSWMQLIYNYLPQSAIRGIEFPLFGISLESVSKAYVQLLKNR